MKKERQGSKDLLHSCGSFRVAHNMEIDFLQAERMPMDDGRTWIKMQIQDEQKIELLREFCLKLISKSHKKNMN